VIHDNDMRALGLIPSAEQEALVAPVKNAPAWHTSTLFF
jgi:hypothetical protein